MMMELKGNLSLATYLSAGEAYLLRKKIYLQARRVHRFPGSLVLFKLVGIEVHVLIFHLSFDIRETMIRFYVISFIPLKSLLLRSGSHKHFASSFLARAELPFRLHGIFFRFLSPFARAENPSPERIFHVITNLILRGFVSVLKNRAEIRRVIRP